MNGKQALRFNPVAIVTLFLFAAGVVRAQTNPVPVINQPLMPASVPPGTRGLTLTVNGTGFVPSAVVNWNSYPLITTYVSSRQLTATVPSINVARPVSAEISVSQPGAAVSNLIDFEVAKSVDHVAVTAANHLIGQINSYCYSIATADFNNDRSLDLVTLDIYKQDFAVLLGSSKGFQKAVKYSIPTGATELVTGDFNNDGNEDVAVAGTGAIYVFAGKGDGTFAPPTAYSAPSDGAHLATADFNGDGVLDFAADTGQGTVAVVINGVASQYAIPSQATSGITVGDFNGDGKLDLAMASSTSDANGAVVILPGNGDGTFQPAIVTTAANYYVYSITAGDFNGDGKLDVAMRADGPYGSTEYVGVFLGNGDGTFGAGSYYLVGNNPGQVRTGDFNNDGILDLAVAQFANSSVAVLLGNGDGTFQSATELLTRQAYPPLSALAVGDFDNDGTLDIAASGGSDEVTVFRQGRGAVASVLPFYLNFPKTVVNTQSASTPVTVTNTGFADLVIDSITTGASFGQTNSCPSELAPLASCTLNVFFKPQQAGVIAQDLTVTDNSPDSPQNNSLNGQGTFLSISPVSLNFGNVKVGTMSPPQTLTISNVAYNALPLAFVVGGSAFSYTQNCGGVIPPRGTCTVSVSFQPKQAGITFGEFGAGSGGSNASADLQGTGTSP